MYEQFKTDAKLEQQGIELLYDSFRVTVARAGGANRKYARLLAKKTKPYRRVIQSGELLPADLDRKIMCEVAASALIKNWETEVKPGEWKQGIESPDGGKLLPFNEENVLMTLQNLPDLMEDIVKQCNDLSLFREVILEGDAKN